MAQRRAMAALASLIVVLPAACGLADEGGDGEQVTLNLSHQWPAPNEDGEGDFRSVLAQRFADQVSERTDGDVQIDVHPGNSLIEDPTEQYDAITRGASDLSVYPLDYASGDVPAFSITLMPAMVPSHDVAQQWEEAEIGQRVAEVTEENGIKVLTWVWNAGAIGSRADQPIVSPDDVPEGSVTRAAGARVEQMLESVGFGLASMPSSDIYNAMQTGVLDSAITSTGSFSSYRLHEQVGAYTSPAAGDTFWFMFEPLIIGMDQFEQLSSEQQEILVEVGADLQDFAYEESEADDQRVHEEFEGAGVNVVSMDEAAFEQWRQASEPIWEDFASEVDGGDELIELARQVSGG